MADEDDPGPPAGPDDHADGFGEAIVRLDAELSNLGAPGTASARVDDQCLALLELLRKRCPDLLPVTDVPAGTVARPVPVPADNAAALIITAMRQAVATGATGRVPPPGSTLPVTALWEEGADALLVEVAHCKITVRAGEVEVRVPVRCDQLPGTLGAVTVSFVVGTPERPTGMFAATGSVPEGPPIVVRRWGDALVALAWQALLDVARGIAGHAGRDADGNGLVPVALVAARTGLVVLPGPPGTRSIGWWADEPRSR